MTHYLRNGNSFRVSEDGKLDVYTELPVGNYIISQDMHGNYYFDRTSSFEMPSKGDGDGYGHRDGKRGGHAGEGRSGRHCPRVPVEPGGDAQHSSEPVLFVCL